MLNDCIPQVICDLKDWIGKVYKLADNKISSVK